MSKNKQNDSEIKKRNSEKNYIKLVGFILVVLILGILITYAQHDKLDDSRVTIIQNNTPTDGFDFPVPPGNSMEGWQEPPPSGNPWDPSSYLVHREDGIHAAVDFYQTDGSSGAGIKLLAIGDGVVIDLVYDREVYPKLHDGEDRDVGWGNLILVQHDYIEDGENKRVYAQYAHCGAIEVKLYETVKRGQRIGLIGHSDGIIDVVSWDDHLHFELRTTNLEADAWPSDLGLTTDAKISKYYTDPLKFIKAHRP